MKSTLKIALIVLFSASMGITNTMIRQALRASRTLTTAIATRAGSTVRVFAGISPIPDAPSTLSSDCLVFDIGRLILKDLKSLQTAKNGFRLLAQFLAQSGACIKDVKNYQGRTILHMAAIYDNAEVANLLLEHGADATTKCNEGKSALDVAVAYGNDSILRLFADRGISLADPTLMHGAFKNWRPLTALLLLQHAPADTDFTKLLTQARIKIRETLSLLRLAESGQPGKDREWLIRQRCKQVQEWGDVIRALEHRIAPTCNLRLDPLA